jgi:hypothetical protein
MRRPDRAGPLPLVLIPGAGGIEFRIKHLVRICEPHGEIMVLDYPDLRWTLRHADLRRIAEDMHARLSAQAAGRPFVLAGVSLGAIVAALVMQHEVQNGGGALQAMRVIGMDPVGSRDRVEIEAGWLARNIARARRAGLYGSPGFLWLRLNRIVAIVLSWCLRRQPRLAGPVASLLGCAAFAELSRELRMRWLIDAAATWRRNPARRHDRVIASAVPCAVFHSAATRLDTEFWQRHFETVEAAGIGGNHDTWYDFEGPERLIGEWTDAAASAAARPVASCS